MSNKTLATHLYSLFIFVAGCVVFWLFGGGEEPENNHVDNKEEIVAQPAAEKLAMEEVQKNVEENELADELFEQLLALPGAILYQPLSTSAKNDSTERDTRWKLNINVQIETDDI